MERLTGSDMNRLTVATMQVEALRKQAADAQATIAALQARVQDLEQWVQDQSTANLETMRHMDEMQSRAMDAEYQLTRRTAELEAVSNFIGVKYDAESKTWVSGQAPYLSAGTTKQEACIAAVDALRLACATWETKYRDLQAELERVRGELVEATHNANVYQSLYSTGCMDRALLENELRDIHTLILALPKVEGEITVSADPDGWYVMPLLIRCVTKEQADGIAALLQERQKLC